MFFQKVRPYQTLDLVPKRESLINQIKIRPPKTKIKSAP